jgi:hypothetical protein
MKCPRVLDIGTARVAVGIAADFSNAVEHLDDVPRAALEVLGDRLPVEDRPDGRHHREGDAFRTAAIKSKS